MDKIIQDQQQTVYRKDKKVAEVAGIIVLENNPCFEMWMLLHFVYTGKLFSSCNEVVSQLGGIDRMPNYAKSEKFLRNARLYKTFKPQLIKNAISNAKRLENNRDHQDALYP